MITIVRKDTRGFTIVGLMITLTVIGTLTATGTPVVRRAHISANEAIAQTSLKTLCSSFEGFRTLSPTLAYPGTLTALQGTIDEALAAGQKNGYTFAITEAGANTYAITAVPTQPNVTGERSFVVDQSGEIQQLPSTAAQETLQVLQQQILQGEGTWEQFKAYVGQSALADGQRSWLASVPEMLAALGKDAWKLYESFGLGLTRQVAEALREKLVPYLTATGHEHPKGLGEWLGEILGKGVRFLRGEREERRPASDPDHEAPRPTEVGGVWGRLKEWVEWAERALEKHLGNAAGGGAGGPTAQEGEEPGQRVLNILRNLLPREAKPPAPSNPLGSSPRSGDPTPLAARMSFYAPNNFYSVYTTNTTGEVMTDVYMYRVASTADIGTTIPSNNARRSLPDSQPGQTWQISLGHEFADWEIRGGPTGTLLVSTKELREKYGSSDIPGHIQLQPT